MHPFCRCHCRGLRVPRRRQPYQTFISPADSNAATLSPFCPVTPCYNMKTSRFTTSLLSIQNKKQRRLLTTPLGCDLPSCAHQRRRRVSAPSSPPLPRLTQTIRSSVPQRGKRNGSQEPICFLIARLRERVCLKPSLLPR